MLRLKATKDGHDATFEIRGSWKHGNTEMEFSCKTHYSLAETLASQGRASAARTMAGQAYAKASNSIRLSVIHTLEAAFNEVLPRLMALPQGHRVDAEISYAPILGLDEGSIAITMWEVSPPDGGTGQGAIETIATLKP